MRILHILKTEPDESTQILMDIISQGEEATVFELYNDSADYETLIDFIFEHDKTITWW